MMIHPSTFSHTVLPFTTTFVAPLNGLLARNPWAQTRLAAFAGKTVELRVFPVNYRISITAEGMVRPTASDRVAHTFITLTPALALRILAGDRTAEREARLDGDTALAQEIAYLAQHLTWEFEEDLSKVFGDVIAYRIGKTARDLNQWRLQASGNLAESFRDYWVHERPLVAACEAVEQFHREVDQLRDDVERLEKRIAKLAKS